MDNKKVNTDTKFTKNIKSNLIIFIIILIIMLVGVFIYFFSSINKTTKINNPPEIVTLSVEALLNSSFGVNNCSTYKDIGTVAISKDIRNCDCLSPELQNECRDYLIYWEYYDQAWEQADPSICNNISHKEGVNYCIKVVNEKLIRMKNSPGDELLNIYLDTNNYDEAITILEGRVLAEQKNVNYLNILAENYAVKALSENEQDVLVPKALALLEKAKTFESNNPEVYKAEGYVYEIKPDLDKALESYNKAISINPDYAAAYAGRGHTQELIGDADAALADFNKAATLDKNQEIISIYANLCRANYQQNNFEATIKNCSIIINSKITGGLAKSEASQIISLLYLYSGDPDGGLTQLKLAQSYAPDDINFTKVY